MGGDDRENLKTGGIMYHILNNRGTYYSAPMVSALGLELHHPIMNMILGHGSLPKRRKTEMHSNKSMHRKFVHVEL